jgi:transcriptional regulator with XRE-family HTH domain
MNERICRYIKENGITFTHVSRQSGITNNKLVRLMRGNTKLTVDDYESICRALNVEPSFFYNEKFLKTKNMPA